MATKKEVPKHKWWIRERVQHASCKPFKLLRCLKPPKKSKRPKKPITKPCRVLIAILSIGGIGLCIYSFATAPYSSDLPWAIFSGFIATAGLGLGVFLLVKAFKKGTTL